MEPVSCSFVPEGLHYCHQVKWDGVRIIAHVGEKKLMLHNRKLNLRTPHYPEMLRLTELVKGATILDGEMIALKEGKPSFPLILERDLLDAVAASGAKRIKAAANRVPVFYMIFDIVYYNGKDLTEWSLRERQELLCEVVREDSAVRLVESFEDGSALFDAVSAKNLEGIVSKEKTSIYYPGRKNNAWLKIKVKQQQLVVIGGYTVRQGQINSLLTGVYHGEKLHYAGRVASGMSERDWQDISTFLKSSQSAVPSLAGVVPSKEIFWVKPQLVVLIEFQEWTEDLRMRHPVIKGFTLNKPEDCVLNKE